MSFNKKLLWGGLGWVFAGPIGAILGYTYASISNDRSYQCTTQRTQTKHGDFVISVLVLFAKVMKADGQLLKSELDYVKHFLKQQFGIQYGFLLHDIEEQSKEELDQDFCRKRIEVAQIK